MTEQRTDNRHDLEHTTVEVLDLESGVEFEGEASNLSGSGLSFRSVMEPPVGADMRVTLQGQEALSAQLHVTRVQPVADGFQVAGRLSRR